MAVHTITEYSEMHDRLSSLREMGIGLDGVICAKGGEIRVHLAYMAACNQTLFKRITTLMKNNQNELTLKEVPIVGIEKIVNFFYHGKLEISTETLPDILEAAMATECLETVEFCVNFANNSNVNLWSHFLQVAFRYPLICQPEEFIPNLVLKNISVIPREALMRDLDSTYLSYILEKGKVEKDKTVCMTLFLDLILNDKKDISVHKHTLCLMNDICMPDDKLTISNAFEDSKVLALLGSCLAIGFTASVRACCELLKQRTPNTEIVEKVVRWIPNHYGTLQAEYLIEYGCSAFKALPLDLPCDVMCELVGADWLELPELDIFERCLQWLKFNKEEPMDPVLSRLRFGRMTKVDIENIIAQYGRYMRCVSAKLMDALQYHLCIYEQPLHEGEIAKDRLAKPVLIGLIHTKYGLSDKLMKSAITEGEPGELVEIEGGLPANVSDIKELSNSAVLYLNGFVFISGGRQRRASKVTNTLYRYDIQASTWLSLSPMAGGRYWHTLTAMGASLLAIGGKKDVKTNLDTMEIYDIAKVSWKQGETMPTNICQHAASCVVDQVYTSGGVGSGSNKSVLCYSEGKWVRKSRLLYGRQCHSMVSYGDMLIVCGGAIQNNVKKWENVTVVECYDTQLDQWTEMSSKPAIPFDSARASCSNGYVYIFGGCQGEGEAPLDEIQRYNLAENKWEICQMKLPIKQRVYIGCIHH